MSDQCTCFDLRECCLKRQIKHEAQLTEEMCSLIRKIDIGNYKAITAYYKDLDKVAKKPWKKNKQLKRKFIRLEAKLKKVQANLLKLGVHSSTTIPLYARPYFITDLTAHLEYCQSGVGKCNELVMVCWRNYEYYTTGSELLATRSSVWTASDDEEMPELEEIPPRMTTDTETSGLSDGGDDDFDDLPDLEYAEERKSQPSESESGVPEP